MAEILYKELSYAIVGAAMEVQRILGPGFPSTALRTGAGRGLCGEGIPRHIRCGSV